MFCPDFQGVIETADGALVMFDWRGYGRTYPVGRRQIVGSATHLAEDERYRWLTTLSARPPARFVPAPMEPGSSSSWTLRS
jgi:hypothetical protein